MRIVFHSQMSIIVKTDKRYGSNSVNTTYESYIYEYVVKSCFCIQCLLDVKKKSNLYTKYDNVKDK